MAFADGDDPDYYRLPPSVGLCHGGPSSESQGVRFLCDVVCAVIYDPNKKQMIRSTDLESHNYGWAVIRPLDSEPTG
jgi:hypothetical protein